MSLKKFILETWKLFFTHNYILIVLLWSIFDQRAMHHLAGNTSEFAEPIRTVCIHFKIKLSDFTLKLILNI